MDPWDDRCWHLSYGDLLFFRPCRCREQHTDVEAESTCCCGTTVPEDFLVIKTFPSDSASPQINPSDHNCSLCSMESRRKFMQLTNDASLAAAPQLHRRMKGDAEWESVTRKVEGQQHGSCSAIASTSHASHRHSGPRHMTWQGFCTHTSSAQRQQNCPIQL